MLDSPLDGIRSPFGVRRGRAFSPSTLFALAEPGVWFDPSDLTTLFQDPAGTTPVTAPGNTVGLMLDKSKALALGAELVANGTFDSGATGWSVTQTSGTATLTASSGVATLANPAASIYATAYQSFTTVVGRAYKVTGQLISASGTALNALRKSDSPGGGTNDVTIYGGSGALVPGTGTGYFIATATTTFVLVQVNGASNTISFDNISVRELAGNHATQATLAARPTYSIEPVGGRRNLLTYSEDLTNPIWTTIGGTTKNSALNFTFTAATSRLYQSFSLISGATYTISTRFSDADVGKKIRPAFFDSSAGWLLLADTTIPVGGVVTRTITMTNAGSFVGFQAASDLSANTSFTLVSGQSVQLELGSTATAYQRVTTQHDVTEAGVASLGYLYFDGVDDHMTVAVDTNTIFGVTGADPGYLLVGGVKYNTAGGSASPWVRLGFCADNAGYFGMWAHTSNGGEAGLYQWDTSAKTAERPYTVGSAAVFTGRRNPSEGAAGKIYASVNGVSSAGIDAAALISVSGTFLVGRQFGNTFLNGNIYSLIARGALTDAATIASTEVWVGDKTGIDIAKITSTTIYTRSGDTILDRANSTIERRAV